VAGLAVGFAVILGCMAALSVDLLGPRGAPPPRPAQLAELDAPAVAPFAGGAVPGPAGGVIHAATDVKIGAPGVVLAELEHTRARLPRGALVRVLPTRRVAAAHGDVPVPGHPTLQLTTISRAQARRDGSNPGDTTPPAITCQTIDPGWHGDNVSIRCSGDDKGSGLADTADAAFTLSTHVAAGDEDPQAGTDSRTICDAAGNCAVANAVALSVDRKAPTVSCGTPDRSWQDANEKLSCTATDGGSGLAVSADHGFGLRTSVADDRDDGSASTDAHKVCDDAGNCTTAGPVNGLRIDRLAPRIHLSQDPNGAHGWFDTAPASLGAAGADAQLDHVTCTADGRSVSDPESPTMSFGSDGTHDVTCTAVDLAGNTTSDTATVRLDTAAPDVSLSTDQASYGVDDTVTVTCSADDALSGVDSRDCPDRTAPAASFALGTHRLTASATDTAGNTASASASFDVTVSVASLTSLTKRVVSDSTAEAALASDLAAVGNAPDSATKASAIATYQSDVRALPSSAVAADDAAALVRFADGL
jgi:hypothetical protein